MASKVEMYRKQVAMVVGIQLGITLESAQLKIADHLDMIEAWCDGGVQFTQTAHLLIPEIKE